MTSSLTEPSEDLVGIDSASIDNGNHDDDDESIGMEGRNDEDSTSTQYDPESSVMDLKHQAAKNTKRTLAREETKAVSCLRYILLLLLICTAVGVALATYYYSRNVEEESFQAEFASVAVVTLRSFIEAVEGRLGALDSVSADITSQALKNGDTFPNVTIADFEVKGATLRTQTDGLFLFWLPLVTDETRSGYEEYTKGSQLQQFQSYFAEEGYRAQQDAYFGINATATANDEDEDDEGQHDHDDSDKHSQQHQHRHLQKRLLHAAGLDEHPVIHDGIWGLTVYNSSDIEPEGTGPYLPLWQTSPVIPLPSIANYNFFAYKSHSSLLNGVIDTGKCVLSYIQTDHEGSETENLIQTMLTMNQYRHQNVSYDKDPMTQVGYPVFDSFGPDRKVTGILATTVFWRLLFEDVLPENVEGVICVLSNSLGEQITYRIDGQTATLLGKGDLHEEKYDDMGVTRDLSEFVQERASPERWSYTSVELDDSVTSYQIHVYPSSDMEALYVTSDPIIYAVVVGSVFIFTSLVFILYDCLVERRQKKVMDKAVRSTAVVSSLFPEAVHDRLFNEAKTEEPKKQDAWKNTAGGGKDMSASAADLFMNTQQKPTKHGRPIADKFQHATVFFADLAGFTKWSSTREPEQVFELLEALYGEFDKIALRRGVFKVETIGDCYMAATGLPNPQEDHAIRMVKFANNCMEKMERILNNLEPSLGPGTCDLEMRVGIHSGEVTGGVLRGDKGRFQLFGDTVNTASRMESNGSKGRIHCSQSTADELINAGKAHWITAREDKIVAKGKGELQTYWIHPGVVAATSVASSATSSHSKSSGYRSPRQKRRGRRRRSSMNNGSLRHSGHSVDSTGSVSSHGYKRPIESRYYKESMERSSNHSTRSSVSSQGSF